jgi:hypothetical protein
MLNWAARYFPILRVLRQHITDGQPVLEVGSGAYGLAYFYKRRMVGCDVKFPCQPVWPMLPVICSAAHLPFPTGSFEVVIASDVLEHIPPGDRQQVVREALRVTRNVAIFGFPCGPLAYDLDRRFFEDFRARGRPLFDWLEEHMQFPFPEPELFDPWGDEWLVKSFGNENLRFHEWMNHRELSSRWDQVFRSLLERAPGLVELALRLADREPFYRRVFVVERKPVTSGGTSR